MNVSIGTDIVEIKRIKRLIEKYRDKEFINRIFCDEEIEYCNKKGSAGIQCYAARFAAKEAAAKALGTGFGNKCGFNEICILNKESGEPYIVLTGTAEKTFKERHGCNMEVSMSHCREYATATVIFIKGD